MIIKFGVSYAIFVRGYSEDRRLVPFRVLVPFTPFRAFRASAFEEVQKKPVGFF